MQFSKKEIARTFDEADNFSDRRTIVYARNACWMLAEQVGCQYFMQLDDDYTTFWFRFTAEKQYTSWVVCNLNPVFESMIQFMEDVPRCHSLAMSQGGDHIGGASASYNQVIGLRRKAMNTFVCDTKKPFQFQGRINEDVNTYTHGGSVGLLFFTFNAYQITQTQTQTNAGGMTDIYINAGTYIKSFYTILFAPSAAKIHMIQDCNAIGGTKGPARIHHHINWDKAVPKILSEQHCKRIN